MLKNMKQALATNLCAVSCMHCMLGLCAFVLGLFASGDEYSRDAMETLQQNIYLAPTYSCRNTCIDSTNRYDKYCSCSALCVVYRNCCEDLATECPEVVTEASERFGHMLDLQVECLSMAGAFAVTSCPNQTSFTKSSINEDSLYDIIKNVPVLDGDTGLVFANIDIFNCNSNLRNASNSGQTWTIYAAIDNLFPNDIVSNIKDYIFHNPKYSVGSETIFPFPCIPDSTSTCNYSVWLQRTCRSFMPHLLLRNLIHNYTLCQACSLNLSAFLREDATPGELFRRPTIQIVPEEGLFRVSDWPWKEARCDMSKNATLSAFECRIVKCNTQLGFYLKEDGTCRGSSLLLIGLQNDVWLLDQHEKDDLFNYMTYYLSRFMNIIPVGAVKPLHSLYSTELRKNFSIATLVLDVTSSPPDDYVYVQYRDELSILASDVRAMVDYKIRQTNKSNTRLTSINDVIGRRSVEIQSKKTHSGLMLYNWCSSPNVPFSLFTTSRDKTPVCLCRLVVYKRTVDQDCLELEDDFELRCYDEMAVRDISKMKHASSFAKNSIGNLLFIFAQFGVVFKASIV